MKPASMPNMIVYTINYMLEGCGTEASQSVLASSFKSAMNMFHKAHSTALITHVDVGDRTIVYGEEDEIIKSESA